MENEKQYYEKLLTSSPNIEAMLVKATIEAEKYQNIKVIVEGEKYQRKRQTSANAVKGVPKKVHISLHQFKIFEFSSVFILEIKKELNTIICYWSPSIANAYIFSTCNVSVSKI